MCRTIVGSLICTLLLSAPVALADDACAGHVAGICIESELLFEALDAHGHDIDPATLTCETCLAAVAHDEFCEQHRRGFVNGQAWLSRLTYELARGDELDPATVECHACRSGWCDEHSRGMIGTVAISNREGYDAAARAFDVLLEAIVKADECETCAAAMVVDGRCAVHRVGYEGGEPTQR